MVRPTPPRRACRARCRSPSRGTTINLSWGASSDTGGSGLAGYDVYRNGTLAGSVSATTTTYADTQPTTATVSYFVRARDNAGNQSGNSNTVTRTGTNPDTTPPTVPGHAVVHPVRHARST